MKKFAGIFALLIALVLFVSAIAEGIETEVTAEAVEPFITETEEVIIGGDEFSEGVDVSEFYEDTVTDLVADGDEPAMDDMAVSASDEEFEIVNGILIKYNGEGGDVVIPDKVTIIGEGAFESCNYPMRVYIPNSVTRIGEYAFGACHEMISVSIPNSVTSIGPSAFFSCSSLTSVSIPNSVGSIDGFAFAYCDSLKKVSIPLGIKSIAFGTFSDCPSLTSVFIPNTVTNIESFAFSGCSALTEVTIPNSVTNIGLDAFSGCSNLIKVSFGNSVSMIYNEAFKGCRLLESIELPSSIETIGEKAFVNCYSLKSVTIDSPKNTDIAKKLVIDESGAHFDNLRSLSIADDAFDGCPSILVFNTRCETPATKWAEDKGYKVAKAEHEPEGITGIPATCTEIGWTEGEACPYCGMFTKQMTEIPAVGHIPEVIPGVDATCTESGLTEGSLCKVCGETLIEQDYIYPTGHNAVIDEAVEPTYTKGGLSEGSHCSVCGKVLVKQKKVPMLSRVSLGTATLTFGNTTYTYTGKALKPAVTVKLNGKSLKKGTDYTVTYKNNKAVGKATVVIKGKGKYKGTAKATFAINPKKVSGLMLKAGEKQLTVSWKKASGITGYQVQYSLKKNFSGAKTITVKKVATAKTVLKKLKAGKTYYVRIRAYKTVKGVKYYSDWSKAVIKKTK